MDKYDVFGDLDEMCNSNILGKLKTTLPPPSTDAKIDDDFNLEDILKSSNDVLTPSKKRPNTNLLKSTPPPSLLPTKRPSPKKPSPPKQIDVASQPATEVTGFGRRTRSSLTRNSKKKAAPVSAPAVTNPAPTKGGRKGRGRPKQVEPPQSSTTASSVIPVTNISEVIDITQAIDIPELPTRSTGARARGRGSRNDVMRSRRNYIAELAARSTNVDYVDLISSPLPRIEGVVNVDSDPEDGNNSTSEVSLNKNSEKRKSLDCSFDEENPEMSVKIKWNGGNPEIFKLRKYQKFSYIFNKLAEREKTNAEFLVFNLQNRIITSEDTPASINYKIYQFIDGRVLLGTFNAPQKKRDANKISLKIQSDQWKRPLKVDLLKTDKFKILYIKCAEELNVPCENIKLSFDGDHLEYNATPTDFEFEGGEAIDLRIRK